MLYTLLIICIIIFIIYHFYVDYRNWSNVGGDFAEGMSNSSGTIMSEDKPTTESEKLTAKGDDYRGFQNKTKGGLTCQNWNSDSTHKRHSAIKKAYEDKKNGTGDHNYCRNPTGNHTNIWCYTTDPNKRWDDCEPLEVEDTTKQKDNNDSNEIKDNSFVLVDDNFKKPTKNSVIDLKDFKMGKDYNLEFVIKPLGKKSGWTNIIHNTFTGENCCRVGDRYPAIWFWSNTTKLHISCGAKNSKNWNTTQNPEYNLPINKETIVNIRLQNNIFTVILTDFNGNVVYNRNQAVDKTKPPKYIIEEKPRFYFSDPWSNPANVQVKNMIITNLDKKAIQTSENKNDITNSNQLIDNLINSLINNSNTDNIPLAQKLQIIQSLQQQHQLPRQVIQILQPPRQINEPMSNTSAANSINSFNTGDQMLQSLPGNVSLQQQSIPRISDFTLFNEDIMKKVLSNKNLIPNDVKVGMENKENYIRIGKNFMIEVSKIRNLALPNIEQDDYEKIGRIASKIYIKNNNNVSQDSIDITKNSLISVVSNILKGGDEINSENSDNQKDTQSSLLRDPNNTTGMFSNNKNKHLSSQNNEANNEFKNVNKTKYTNNARISKSDLNGSLCMWDGCEASGKKPYDSVYSIF